MTPTARNICTCAVFSTTSFNFGLPTYFVSHYCYGRASYAVFYRRAELFVCIVLTQCFCFASSVRFGSFCLASSETGVAFPSRRLLYTSICLSIFVFLRSMFAFILLFVDFIRYLTFWHDMIQIYRCSRKKYVDYLVCSICRYGIDQALFYQLKVIG